jgi:ribokinase
VAAVPVTAVDTTGRGDALAGALLAGLARGLDAEAALRAAMPFAARCVAALGSLPPPADP